MKQLLAAIILLASTVTAGAGLAPNAPTSAGLSVWVVVLTIKLGGQQFSFVAIDWPSIWLTQTSCLQFGTPYAIDQYAELAQRSFFVPSLDAAECVEKIVKEAQ